MATRREKQVILTVLLAALFCVFLVWFTPGDRLHASTAPATVRKGDVTDYGTHLVYFPRSLVAGRKYPLVFALSPGADAASMTRTWSQVADAHGWIVAASKEFRNGVAWNIVMPQIISELNAVERTYPVDLDKVVFAGLSGGAMGSHAMAGWHPNRLKAIVLNTGMMNESLMVADYPRAKLAVFLASPTDFRYHEMHRDRAFLDAHGWTTTWIEFQGGHTFAPPATYEAAAAWLEQHW